MDKIDEKTIEFTKELVTRLNLRDPSVEFDEEGRRINIIVDEGEWFKKWIPDLVKHLKQLINLSVHKESEKNYFVDINNYRKERERLIIELGRAAARKAVGEKKGVRLPAMNAYERRLVHMELSMRPDIKTESEGEGKDRHITVNPL
ncbi:MAG: R3H domain-containing nucleic acid-binding protein [Candidatus Harrisonbacteria bacterium]|nr:R3H domain-containing nucleic acid-binding protein [Candidatus Harrisonbacteria bacterium]